jgi:hypothetical protein
MNEATKTTHQGANQAELDACLSRIGGDIDVARTLLAHIQGEAETQPEIYSLLEALDSVICRIGFTNTVLASRINPKLFDAPDAQDWMPIRHTAAVPV